jgi:hypothetical protein
MRDRWPAATSARHAPWRRSSNDSRSPPLILLPLMPELKAAWRQPAEQTVIGLTSTRSTVSATPSPTSRTDSRLQTPPPRTGPTSAWRRRHPSVPSRPQINRWALAKLVPREQRSTGARLVASSTPAGAAPIFVWGSHRANDHRAIAHSADTPEPPPGPCTFTSRSSQSYSLRFWR